VTDGVQRSTPLFTKWGADRPTWRNFQCITTHPITRRIGSDPWEGL